MTTRRRSGPDPLPKTELRATRISVYLSEGERAKIEASAAAVAMTAPEYLRTVGLDKLPPIVPEVNRELWRELSRAGSNLNQIAKRLNEGGDLEDIEDLRTALREFRARLLGERN